MDYAYLVTKLRGAVPDKTAMRRATDALYRRGFSWEEIKSALQRYKSELDTDLFSNSETED
jgi:SOS response regulatory protein OraA/RecX